MFLIIIISINITLKLSHGVGVRFVGWLFPIEDIVTENQGQDQLQESEMNSDDEFT